MKLHSAYEVVLNALFGNMTITSLAVGVTGIPVTPNTRVMPVSATSYDIDEYYFEKDETGVYKALVVVATIPDNVTYDTVGLLTNTNVLFAAESVPETTTVGSYTLRWKVELK